jgi:aspartokinase
LEEAIEKVRMGGLKVVDGGVCVASSWQNCAVHLDARICAPLARERINLTLLTHVDSRRGRDCATVFCSEAAAGTAGYTLLADPQGNPGVTRLHPGICIISLYPHDNRPEIVGRFIRSLAQARIKIRALASSRSAISGVISATAKKRAIEALFQHFTFSSYASPREFYDRQLPPEELVREVIASYQENVIRIYLLEHQPDLDLWEIRVPSVAALEDKAAALMDLGAAGFRMPFLIAVPAWQTKELLISFCFSPDQRPGNREDQIRRVLDSHLPGIKATRQRRVATIFIHGPHFGDRFGIAHALAEALEKVRIRLLALSCSVSSISAIVRQRELATALQALEKTFEVPG